MYADIEQIEALGITAFHLDKTLRDSRGGWEDKFDLRANAIKVISTEITVKAQEVRCLSSAPSISLGGGLGVGPGIEICAVTLQVTAQMKGVLWL